MNRMLKDESHRVFIMKECKLTLKARFARFAFVSNFIHENDDRTNDIKSWTLVKLDLC